MNRALICGINAYPQSPLQGCLNDVDSIAKLLVENFKFSPMRIVTLKDGDATKDAILAYLRLMIQETEGGDHLVFSFSGHGSQVPDQDGDESDGLDEIICCSGFDWSDGTFIKDDEIRALLNLLDPGATIDIVCDSCHSGTMERDATDRAKCIPFPVPLAPTFRAISPFLKELEMPNVALWAGCKDTQTSADAFIGGKHQGAMTWAFCQHAGKSKNRLRDIQHINVSLSQRGYEQTPQLECTAEMKLRKVFE